MYRKNIGFLRYEKAGDVVKMKQYVQHGSTSTYDHCINVTSMSFRINRRLHLHADENLLAEMGMLHDFYLYDWHEKDDSHRLHGFYHPKKAADNARRIYGVGDQTYRAIECHMWPLTITKVPHGREAWILCLADKISTVAEVFAG